MTTVLESVLYFGKDVNRLSLTQRLVVLLDNLEQVQLARQN